MQELPRPLARLLFVVLACAIIPLAAHAADDTSLTKDTDQAVSPDRRNHQEQALEQRRPASQAAHPQQRLYRSPRLFSVDRLWVRQVDGSASRPLTHFTSESIFAFRYSPDGKNCDRADVESDAVLLRDASR